MSVARRPPDANHPYGHRKYETVAAFGIAGMLFLGCREIAVSALERVRHPVALEIGPAAYAVMIVTISINLIVFAVESREGRQLQSELLVADAAHTRSDLFASLLVIASFVAHRVGFAWADVAASAVIVVLVFKAGLEIVKARCPRLSDERRIPPADVGAEALLEPGVLEAPDVRSRGTPDDVHVGPPRARRPRTPLAEAPASAIASRTGSSDASQASPTWSCTSGQGLATEPRDAARGRRAQGPGLGRRRRLARLPRRPRRRRRTAPPTAAAGASSLRSKKARPRPRRAARLRPVRPPSPGATRGAHVVRRALDHRLSTVARRSAEKSLRWIRRRDEQQALDIPSSAPSRAAIHEPNENPASQRRAPASARAYTPTPRERRSSSPAPWS
jgi:hypothetical protein